VEHFNANDKKAKSSTTRTLLVYLGDTGLALGEVQFSRKGQKRGLGIPALPLSTDFQYHTASKETSTFADAIADTETDGCGHKLYSPLKTPTVVLPNPAPNRFPAAHV
jgi:serine/threonine-protein kinase HipA